MNNKFRVSAHIAECYNTVPSPQKLKKFCTEVSNMYNTKGTVSYTRMGLFVNRISVTRTQPDNYSDLQRRSVNVVQRTDKGVSSQ